MLVGRHATSVHNKENPSRFDWGNPALDPVGYAEAKLLGRFAASYGIGRIICAPNLRSIQTAVIAAQNMSREVEITVEPALHEGNWGEWSGLPIQETFADPVVTAQVRALGLDFCPPGGESMSQIHARMHPALLELDVEDVLVVGSNFSTKTTIGVELGLARADILDIKIANAEVLEFNPSAPGYPIRVFHPLG